MLGSCEPVNQQSNNSTGRVIVIMAAQIFDKETLDNLEAAEMPTIEITLPTSVSYQESKLHPKPVILQRGNTLSRCLEHLCVRKTAGSGGQESSDNLSDSKRTLFSNTAERLSSEFDSSLVSEANSDEIRLGRIQVGLSKSMCRPKGEQGAPNRLFLTRQVLKPEFTRLCQEFLLEQYYSKKAMDSWDLDQLYRQFGALPYSDPFIPSTLCVSTEQSVCSFMQNWLFKYCQHSSLILSFDFILNHPSLLLVLIFYWVKAQASVSPLCSASQHSHLAKNCLQLRLNILSIMRDQLDQRGREISRNGVLGKIMAEFFRYVLDKGEHGEIGGIRSGVRDLWERLLRQTVVEEEIRKTMAVETKHQTELLQRLYENYQNRDKLIKDRLQDVVELFYETDKSLILMTPLSNYYEVGLGENSLKECGKRHSLLSCWLLSLVIAKTRSNGRQAIQYVARYIDLLQQFYRVGSYQSAVMFGGLVSNIRTFMPTLWSKTVQSHRNVEQRVDFTLNQIQLPLFSDKIQNSQILFSNTEVYRLVEATRSKFQKKYLVMNFHKRIQAIAKNVLACRSLLEAPYQQGKRQSRMNLNQKFIGAHVYEVLQRDSGLGFEELKREARKADREICFPLLHLY